MRKMGDIYRQEREAGMKYREIAAKYGVSHQAVAQACAKRDVSHFRKYTKEECIYPNLRRWLNENKVCRYEFVRRMGVSPGPTAANTVSHWFRGTNYPVKKNIDKILAITGLTYEELWEEETT